MLRLMDAYWLTNAERDTVLDLAGDLYDGAILTRNRPTGAYTLEIPSAAQVEEYKRITGNGASSMASQHVFTHLEGLLMFVRFEYETQHLTWHGVRREVVTPGKFYPNYSTAGGTPDTGIIARNLISNCIAALSDQKAYNYAEAKDGVKVGFCSATAGYANSIMDFAPAPLLTALRRLHPLAFYGEGRR